MREVAEREKNAGEGENVRTVDLSIEEWNVVRALRQSHDRTGPTSDADGNWDREAMIALLEDEIFGTVAATLDRMLERADQTSLELDGLLARLSETSPHRSAAS